MPTKRLPARPVKNPPIPEPPPPSEENVSAKEELVLYHFPPQYAEGIVDTLDILITGQAFNAGVVVSNLEQFWARLLDRRVVAVNSVQNAYRAIAHVLSIDSPSQEIMFPAYGALESLSGALFGGATPRFVDVTPIGNTINPAEIELTISERTRAIVAVHTHGSVFDVKALHSICEKTNTVLIEDATEAYQVSTVLNGVGKMGHFTIIALPHIQGALIAVDTALHEYALRACVNPRNSANRLSPSYVLSDMHASAMLYLSTVFAEIAERAHENAQLLHSLLSPLSGLTLPPSLSCSRFLLSARNLRNRYAEVAHLAPALPVYPCILPEQPMFSQYPYSQRIPVYALGMYPVAESIIRNTIAFGTEHYMLAFQTQEYIRFWAKAFAESFSALYPQE